MMNELVPVVGSCVRKDGVNDTIGRVVSHEEEPAGKFAYVVWMNSQERERLPIAVLKSGFMLGMEVQDVPYSRIRASLGEGTVVETRTLGHREQVLVDFPNSGLRHWLPWQNLRFIRGLKTQLNYPVRPEANSAELFRLRCLAVALEMWNENTGALSKLDIDPLPHQIHLVHHILASGNLNWLIADDVGLGKTIEVGMLISALKHRGNFRRILIVTPSGLTRQWRDELAIRFGLDDFQIYGDDFRVDSPIQWKLHDHTIASIDKLKGETHLQLISQAAPWDMIIFDEAHRLSRREYGSKIDSSDRYRLAAALRRQTESIILLSATPHQGMSDKFSALLEILRPELKSAIRSHNRRPEILEHLVIRNNKSDVTDSEGNFIFRGKTTSVITAEVTPEALQFERNLADYLTRGYTASSEMDSSTGKAVGFVMTVYRKLAASSTMAIAQALRRRLAKISAAPGSESKNELELSDDRFIGEWEESIENSRPEFFPGEKTMLTRLCEEAELLAGKDSKLACFLDVLHNSVLRANSNEKVLIFTEYRATQDYLISALSSSFGKSRVASINGGLNRDERIAAITLFEDTAQFLISTEAGGEGINLQKSCHIMFNYDLPWNPMRLIQRIGRLYRYGQKKKVAVFNLQYSGSIDSKILELMYQRLQEIVKDLAPVSEEFRPGLEDEILGQMAELVEVEELLDQALHTGIERTKERIEEAMQRAKSAVEKQRELFSRVNAYDPNVSASDFSLSPDHFKSFVLGMFRHLGITIDGQAHSGLALEIVIPPSFLDMIPGLRGRMVVSFDRLWASNRPQVHLLDIDSALVRHMLQLAKSHNFGGITACLNTNDGSFVTTAVLRWQNDQGRRMRQEFAACSCQEEGPVTINPQSFREWLISPADGCSSVINRDKAKLLFDRTNQAAQRRLAELSNRDLHPENLEWIGAAWDSSEGS
jgi:superfamily II DNA or RNA helicase